jgi:hypothetical protein
MKMMPRLVVFLLDEHRGEAFDWPAFFETLCSLCFLLFGSACLRLSEGGPAAPTPIA